MWAKVGMKSMIENMAYEVVFGWTFPGQRMRAAVRIQRGGEGMKSPTIDDRAPGRQVAPAESRHDGSANGETRAQAAGGWAICCSGGGIRSAAYCLGALQRLDRNGLLARVKWILGVSGGSYIASSRALVAHHLPAGTKPHAYARGTAWREDTRRRPNGSPHALAAGAALAHPASRVWKGYWQRAAARA